MWPKLNILNFNLKTVKTFNNSLQSYCIDKQLSLLNVNKDSLSCVCDYSCIDDNVVNYMHSDSE